MPRNQPPSRKGSGEERAAKYESIYKYFESLGPTRSLEAVSKAWKNLAGETMIRRMAAKCKWFERAQAFDDKQLRESATANASKLDYQYQLFLDGINATLEDTFIRDPMSGRVRTKLKIETWEDAAKAARIRDYLMGDTGRDPKDLANPTTFSMAIVALMQEFKAEGHDPYYSPVSEVRKWLPAPEPTSTAA